MTPHGDLSATAPRDVLIQSPSCVPPWNRSWFYCARGKVMILVWVILLHLAAITGLVLLPFPGWMVIGAAAVLLWLGGLGTTIAYHRSLTHRALVLHPILRHVLIFFALFNGSGNPVSWVVDHRQHHALSDREGDISSPRQGFWWSHLRWLWQAAGRHPDGSCRDMQHPQYRLWARVQIPVLATALLGGLLLAPCCGWHYALAAALWLGPLRLLFALHVQCTVNSICHLGTLTPQRGSSMNVWWLAPLHMGQGENWHGNHHQRQSSPRLGYGFWQLDTSWWIISVLGWFGLATQIKATGPGRHTFSSVNEFHMPIT